MAGSQRYEVILLGHRGFVGSAIADAMLAKHIRFLAVGPENYESNLGASGDILINANGSSDKRLAAADPLASFKMNVTTALSSATQFRYDRYILVSSVDVYNDPSRPDHNEEEAVIDPLRLSPYGFTKVMTEAVVRRFAPRWLILRLGPLVGPRLRKNPVFDVLERRTAFVHPESAFSFIDTRDVAEVLWELRNEDGQIYNVAGRGTVRLRELATMVGISLPPESEALPKQTYAVNVEKLAARLGAPESRATLRRYLSETERPGR